MYNVPMPPALMSPVIIRTDKGIIPCVDNPDIRTLSTPYYQNILTNVDSDMPDNLNQAEPNYTPYDILVLNTRLTNLTEHTIGKGVWYNYISVPEQGVLRLRALPKKGKEPVYLTDKQVSMLEDKIIQFTIGKYILLFDWRTVLYTRSGKPIPKHWVYSILPYLPLPDNTYFYVADGQIMIYLAHILNYNVVYDYLGGWLVDIVRVWYDTGYIVGISPEQAESFGLECVSNDGGLYRPSWQDTRLYPIAYFLEEMLVKGRYVMKNEDYNLELRGVGIKQVKAILPPKRQALFLPSEVEKVKVAEVDFYTPG